MESLTIGQAIKDLQEMGVGLRKIESQQELDLKNRGGMIMLGSIITLLPERDLIPTRITRLHQLLLQL